MKKRFFVTFSFSRSAHVLFYMRNIHSAR